MTTTAETLLRHREQRGGYSAATTGCSCGWAPVVRTVYATTTTPVPIEASQLRQWAEHVADASRPACPECVAGKHRNCDSTSWNTATDTPCPCSCWASDHRGAA